MAHQDVLIELIKNLNKTEKRYVQVKALQEGEGEEKNTAVLFNAIDKLKQSNDDAILTKIAGSSAQKNFNYNKHYLYETILRSLEQFHYNCSKEQEIASLLHRYDILFQKKLFRQCLKILDKAEKLAKEYELLPMQLLVMEKRLLLVRSWRYTTIAFKAYDLLFFEYRSLVSRIHQLAELHISYYAMLIYSIQTGFARTREQLSRYRRFLKEPVLKATTTHYGFWEWYYHFNIYIVAYSVSEDYKKAHLYSKKLYALIRKNKHIVKEQPAIVISLMGNLVLGATKIKQFEHAAQAAEEFRNLGSTYGIKQKGVLEEIFYLSRQFQLQYLVTAGKVEQAMEVVKEIETHGYAKDQLLLNATLMAVCFAAGDYARTNVYVLEIQKSTYSIRNDLACFARIYRVITLVETERYDLIDYTIKQTLRDLRKQGKLYEVEWMLMNFVQHTLQNCTGKSEIKQAYLQFKKELKKVLKTKVDKRVLSYFDILLWVDSKIEGLSYKQKIRMVTNK